MNKLYFEDLRVGQRFVSPPHTVDEAQIRTFACEFDPQPFHLDPDAARQTLFGGLAASGWHTAALTMKLLVQAAPIAGGILGSGGELAWPQPTRPGDVLHVEAEITGVIPSRSRPDRGSALMRIETRNHRDEILQTFDVRIVVPVRPA
ncbi:MaoC family dehydratase [Ferrovibrio sp.]|jgi:acyl dehydratase|uniref:MaoC family dehydratase n=1 Tax=Ferrovibrio sp. TaxID=1917215 RepID=UPI00311E459D